MASRAEESKTHLPHDSYARTPKVNPSSGEIAERQHRRTRGQEGHNRWCPQNQVVADDTALLMSSSRAKLGCW